MQLALARSRHDSLAGPDLHPSKLTCPHTGKGFVKTALALRTRRSRTSARRRSCTAARCSTCRWRPRRSSRRASRRCHTRAWTCMPRRHAHAHAHSLTHPATRSAHACAHAHARAGAVCTGGRDAAGHRRGARHPLRRAPPGAPRPLWHARESPHSRHNAAHHKRSVWLGDIQRHAATRARGPNCTPVPKPRVRTQTRGDPCGRTLNPRTVCPFFISSSPV